MKRFQAVCLGVNAQARSADPDGVTPKYIRDSIAAGRLEPSYQTRKALEELAGISTISQLLCSQNAGVAGNGGV